MGHPIHLSPRRRTGTILAALFAGAIAGPIAAPGAGNAQAQPLPVQPASTVPTADQGVAVVAAGAPAQTPTAAPVLVIPKFSDPLADTAAVALGALKGRGPLMVNAGVNRDPAVASDTAVSVGQTWTSVVMDTDKVGDYLLGAQVVVPRDPATQAVLGALPSEGAGRYRAAIRQVASLTASRIKGSSAADFEAAWSRTDDRRMTVILTALAQVGTVYRFTGNKPGGFDCSGLTSYSWLAAGVKIPRTSGDQINAVPSRAAAELLPGDLMYRPGHIGLYLGVSDYMVHAPQTGKVVEVKRSGKMTQFGSPLS